MRVEQNIKRLDGLDNHIQRIDAWQETSSKRTEVLEQAVEASEKTIKGHTENIESLKQKVLRIDELDQAHASIKNL